MRLTFLSQQQRALNLIWALSKKGKLSKATRLTVVGAGLAGLTAAYAAAKLGVTVTLIESKLLPLHLQRGSQLRFVHPHILDWPAKISEAPLTDLPCLNWGADMAARVCNEILVQWKEVEETIQCFYGYEVREINRSAAGTPVVFAEGTRGNYSRSCDCLILAVGFGLESTIPTVPFLSYWENDNFGRPLITGPLPRNYLVSGCGDGGLIDAIRLCINAFDHADFVYMISRVKELKSLKRILPRIDLRVAARLKNDVDISREVDLRFDRMKGRVGESLVEAKAKKRIIDDIEGQLLEEEYGKLSIPDAVVKVLSEQMREDTVVFLNSPSISPLNLRASILNRFVVFLLRKFGALRYRAGQLEVTQNQVAQKFQVRFHHDQFPIEELDVHEIVVRHGPISVIDRLFPRHIAEDCRLGPDDLDDPTREPLYPRDFLISKDPLLVKRKQIVRLQYAMANSSLAARDRFDSSRYDRFGIQMIDGKVSYTLRPSRSNPSQPSVPVSSFFGIPFQIDPPAGAPFPVSPPPTVQDVLLVHGTAIRSIGHADLTSTRPNERLRTLATLGCFAQLKPTGERGIITTVSALGDPRLVDVNDRIIRASEIDTRKASVIALVSRVRLPTPSSPKASLSDETIQYNRVDAAFAKLSPSIGHEIGFGILYPEAPKLKYDPEASLSGEHASSLIQVRVFKVGASTGLTRGRIHAVLTTASFPSWKDTYHYQGLFSIVSLDGEPFGAQGDGGALVVREDGAVLGLLLGGSEDIAFAIPIETVLSALDCELLLTKD
jgi:hypothetical protein